MPILIITVASSKTSMPRISTIAHFSPCKYSIRNEVVECNRHHGFLGPTAPSAFYNVYRSRLMSCFDFLNASAFVVEGFTSNTKVWTRRWPHIHVLTSNTKYGYTWSPPARCSDRGSDRSQRFLVASCLTYFRLFVRISIGLRRFN